MKLVSYRNRGEATFGAVVDGGVAELKARLGGRYADLGAVLAAGALAEAEKAARGAAADVSLDDIDYLLPVPNPPKIFCVGRNYRAYHEVQEEGSTPEYPSIFGRFTSSFTAHGEALLKPRESDQLDYEGELGVIIGTPGRHVPEADALDYIGGYTCMNEGTVRDWSKRGTQNCPAKNFYRSGSIGPWMVTADEIADPMKLHIRTTVSGDLRQDGGTELMIFDIAYVIAHISKFTRLEPGDIIATGSPGGSAIEMDPQAWLKAGDTLEVDISGVGTLENPVAAE
jgi:2-keto-4-pentenoate hydratase/2-oxohepta-3-ene-1,7-dioic acid hydratase in catechol pathway